MFKRILIAVDKSLPAIRAVEVGACLAQQLGANVGLVHVVDSARAFHPEIEVIDEALMTEMRREGKAILDAAAVNIPQGVAVDRLLPEGEPSEQILESAKEWQADLIVIGNDSRGRLAHFLLGSTADAVIRRAACPVTTVRADGKGKGAEVAVRAAAI